MTGDGGTVTEQLDRRRKIYNGVWEFDFCNI
jgi:hypothetical protein